MYRLLNSRPEVEPVVVVPHTILIEVSLHAVRQSVRYRRLYEKFRVQKRCNAGKVAVARQMIEDAWTMLRKRQGFREPVLTVPTRQPARAG
jgi:hypothetical protein